MSSKTKIWTVDDFRRELKLIDDLVREKQGITLTGAELDIEFSNSKRVLGCYYIREMKFRFSADFFNSSVPEACALDVIRHEYAHYYTHVVFGVEGGHGPYFKAACKIVGAMPSTYYSPFAENMARIRENERAKTYSSKLKTGQTVVHPKYGKGRISAIENGRTTALLTVDFDESGERKIDEVWLLKNGKTA